MSMLELTRRQIIEALFMNSETTSSNSDPRIAVLVTMVFDLMLEVEALRESQLAAHGQSADRGTYGRAYRDVSYLAHNSAGMSSGLEKLLSLFYPAVANVDDHQGNDLRTWRETLMMQRLGFSAEAIEKYQSAAQQAETFS